jgi:hypothetical protein
MQYQSIFRRIFVCFLGLIASISLAMAPMPMGNPGAGMPSLDDIQAMEAEIDKFVRTLPPEQQKQFYKDVEELTGIMEKMTPDELNEFVGSVFTDAGLIEQPAPAKPAPKPEPIKPKEEVKPATKVTTAPTAPTEKAVNMISAIIKRTEEFMRKAQVISELQAKMDKWVVQKKLLDVAAKLDWQMVERQIDELNVLLYSLLELDPVTKQYKHIGNLIKDEALYNNLATLQVTLDAYVPTVQVPPFGLETVSKESRAAIREVLSQYLEAFYLLNVPPAIKKVKALYEPRAKELKEEEKLRAEKAYGEAQKPRTPAPAVKSSGTKASSTSPSTPSTSLPANRSYDYDYPYSYNPSSTKSAAPTPSTPDIWEQNKTYSGSALLSPKAAPKDSKGGGGKEGEKGKPGTRGKGTEDGFGEETSNAPGESKPSTPKKDQALEYKVMKVSFKVDDSMKKLKEFDKEFKDFSGQFFDQNAVSVPDAKDDDKSIEGLKKRIAAIEEANTGLKEAISDIKKLKNDINAMPENQEEYKKLISSQLADAVKFYQTIRNGVNSFTQVQDLHKDKLPNKYYIYFGLGTPSDAIKKAIPKIPVTMDAFAKTINDFMNAAK